MTGMSKIPNCNSLCIASLEEKEAQIITDPPPLWKQVSVHSFFFIAKPLVGFF